MNATPPLTRGFVAILCLMIFIPLLAADTAVSNLAQPNDGSLNSNVGTFGTTGSASAQGFMTGANALGYALDSVTLGFISPGGFGSPGDLRVELWDDDSGSPGSVIAEFGINNPDSAGDFTFPLIGSFTLQPNTHYFISASTPDASTSGQNTYFWRATMSTSLDAGGLAGWSIDDGFRTSAPVWDPNDSTPWNGPHANVLQVAVEATAIPEPACVTIVLVGAGLLLARSRFRIS